jgi:DNA adenine methylase
MTEQKKGSKPESGCQAAPPRLTGPLKWHGGKYYLTKPIRDLMPKAYRHYVELFGGGLAVLWALNPVGKSEVVNDLNGRLTNFYRVLQNEKLFKRFVRRVQAVPFSRAEWEAARQNLAERPDASRVMRAVWFFVLNRMSLAGRMDDFAAITKNRVRRGMNEQTSAWLGAVAGLPQVHARLRRVVVENRPAIELMTGHDVEGCVQYCDPPYLACTRTAKSVYGEFEMTDADHREFLAVAKSLKHAKVLISGYPSEMYDKALKSWNRRTFDRANNAAGGEAKRRMTEVVWMNY